MSPAERHTWRSGAAVMVASLAVAALSGCAPQAPGTEALADEVVAVSNEFADILKRSAHAQTRMLDDRVFTPLGRDYRQLSAKGSMVAVPRGLLSSAIDERRGSVIMVLSTTEHSEQGITQERSNAFTCFELTGTFDADPKVERRNVECAGKVMESYLGTNHFSIDELDYRP